MRSYISVSIRKVEEGTQMKKILFFLLIAFAMTIPICALAANKSVTIEWTMPQGSTANVVGYNMYYSYNAGSPDTDNPIQNCSNWEEISANTFKMTCPTVNIDKYPIYFFIGAITSDGEIILSPYDLKEIMKVENFKLVGQ